MRSIELVYACVAKRDALEWGVANLPAGLGGEGSDTHAESGAPRTRSSALLEMRSVIIATSAASELDDQALTHEG